MIAMALACRPRLIDRRRADHRAGRDGAGAGARRCSPSWSRDLGVGLLMISHDLSVLADVCDRVAVMYAGRMVETGTAPEVFDTPLHPYAAALSGAFPRIGDPAVPLRARRPAGRPARPPGAARGLHVPPALPAWRASECRTHRAAPAARSATGDAACLLAGSGRPWPA